MLGLRPMRLVTITDQAVDLADKTNIQIDDVSGNRHGNGLQAEVNLVVTSISIVKQEEVSVSEEQYTINNLAQ